MASRLDKRGNISSRLTRRSAILGATALLGGVVPVALLAAPANAIVAGAGFTTVVDPASCLNGTGAVNCNLYAAPSDVYMSGGPSGQRGLSDGSYFFSVVEPGTQSSFLTAGLGLLSSDDVDERTFTVVGGQVDTNAYTGGHTVGFSATGRRVIGLAPFTDTGNPGGVYVLAICQTGATSPSQCKYDAFKVQDGGGTVSPFAVASGRKYFDVNHNGVKDPGEPGIGGWEINFQDEVPATLVTDATGTFSGTLLSDHYTVSEALPALTTGWVQTGPSGLAAAPEASAGSTAARNADMTYDVQLGTGDVSGLDFGNVCTITNTGGKTLGFWSNSNGQAILTSTKIPTTWAADLNEFALVGQTSKGVPLRVPVTDYKSFRTWILAATATNAQYMLSAQLAATVLNTKYQKLDAGMTIQDGTQWKTLAALLVEAKAVLTGDLNLTADSPKRTRALQLKTIFDDLNNNRKTVTPSTAAACANPFPAPVLVP